MSSVSPIANQIWQMKYRLKDAAGNAVDKSVNDTWRRVAGAVASVETRPEDWTTAFYNAMTDFRFLPAGRILAGAGSGRDVTLFNCFVMGTIPDDMAGIFQHLKEAALTMQQGGGIGYDVSTLRPKGAPVAGVGADASGPLSFMDVWDAMCRTIMSAGYRRGAMMATLRCDHPDIEAFIEAKQESGRLRMFNLSVLVTDAFMTAVKEDAPWDLSFSGTTYRTVSARELWQRIMRATYGSAEPGVIFIDRINQANNLNYIEDIAATNPCGEQPLPPYGACLLGSMNLSRFVDAPFTDAARLDLDALAAAVPVAIRMLDNVIDVSQFPLPEQRHEAHAKRRIGLGVTGLADALIMCGARYGSRSAVALTDQCLGRITREAYLASTRLAAEKGPFPLFDAAKYLDATFAGNLPQDIREAIATHGIRNALLTSIAPTGTISIFADNVSSGIEPVYSFEHTRNVTQPDGSRRAEQVSDYAYRLYRQQFGTDAPLPDYFVDAQSLSPADHLVMQATAQRHIDSSISKTINCPEELGFDAFVDIYRQAYDLGAKGCTTYRPNDVTGAVLQVDKPPASPAVSPATADSSLDAGVVYMTQPLERPEELPGRTYKIRWPETDHAFYITVNDVIRDGRRRPFEIFINSKSMEHYAWTVALTRMISAVFRRGGDVSFVVAELKAVFDPRGGQWMAGRYVPSLLAAIGEVIERHMIDIGFLPAERDNDLISAIAASNADPSTPSDAGEIAAPAAHGRQCPKCGMSGLIHQEGCDQCLDCGYSKCG